MMITLERCKELLEHEDGLEQVEVCGSGFVRAKFTNRMDPTEPHDLVLHPVEEKQVLKVVVPHIARAKSNVELYRVLSHLNYDMLLGKVGVDQDGEVRLEVNQACRDGAEEDPGRDVFARLVELAMDTTQKVAVLVTYWGMLSAGVPEPV